MYNDTVSLSLTLCVCLLRFAPPESRNPFANNFFMAFRCTIRRHCERCITTFHIDGAVPASALSPPHVFTERFRFVFLGLISAGGFNLRQLMFFILFNANARARRRNRCSRTHCVRSPGHKFNCFSFLFSLLVSGGNV